MTWFKVDDMLHAHPKTRRAGLDAMGLWVVAGSYCSGYKLDGFIDGDWVDGQRRGRALAERLVSVGLWHGIGHSCESCPQPVDGYVFHDWSDSNPTADEVEAKRAADRERQRARRARVSRVSHAGVTRDVRSDTAVSHGTPTRPDPTRNKRSSPRRADALAEFEQFWAAYPRKVGKAAAEKAWTKVTDHEPVLAAVGPFAERVRYSEPRFIPHPATWLNGRRWEDQVDEWREVPIEQDWS